MSKTLEFVNCADIGIEIERTEEFYNLARELGDLIKSLPLQNDQHNTLVEKIIDQVCSAEDGAFKMGLKMGCELGQMQIGK